MTLCDGIFQMSVALAVAFLLGLAYVWTAIFVMRRKKRGEWY